MWGGKICFMKNTPVVHSTDSRGLFLKGAEKFPHPGSHSKISNLMISEQFCSHILNMNRGSLHTRSFRRIHLSVFRYRLIKNGSAGPKSFWGF